ncbi:hypothetical protein [Winogradskyella sp. 3972H.M.0a.05]|uniref:hypothetical protein n=1 Tax=Winogradskyella sp. 3972H.M.0a.05 TaxID=2950277 RepID=UPI0033970038
MIRQYLFGVLLIFTGFNAISQTNTDVGLKGGLNFTFFNVQESNFGENAETEVSYFAGLFLDFEIDEYFSIQPEVLYIGLSDFKFINAPIYAKYEVARNFDLMVGPSLNYFFDFFNNKFKVRADICAAYNITSKLDIHTKYTIGFEEISPNGIFIGLGYRI